ncbi:uncharacterized protein LOC143975939 [Lithobates pipiens]
MEEKEAEGTERSEGGRSHINRGRSLDGISARGDITGGGSFVHCSSTSKMAAIEAALARLRAQAAVKGPEWLTRQVQELLGDSDEARGGGGTVPRARRSRPPARFSPGPAPRPPRDRRSPGRDGSVPPAKKRQQECRGSGRSTRRRPAPGSGATGSTCAGSPSHSPATSRVGVLGGGPSTSGVRVEEVPGAEDGRSVARKLETGRKGRRPADGQAGRRGGQVEEQGGTGGHHRSGPHRRSGSAHPGETHLSSRRSVAASGGGSPRGLPSQAEADVAERSEGELSTEDEVADPAVESGSAAVGAVPGRPDGGAPRLVWIVGHSYVCWGARRGDMRPDGRQLGISRRAAELHWLGIPGMQWDRVMGVVDRYVLLDGPPDVLVLHAGGNDLGLLPEQTFPENKTQDDSPSRVKLYVSAVLSLVPFVLDIIVVIFWFLIKCDHVRDQLHAITRGLQIFWISTILCQVVSLCCWSCHGCLGQLLTAIPITAILIGDVIFCVWRACKHRGLSSRSVAINAPVPIAHREEASPEESGGSAQVPVCECWPRCGESSTFHHAALSPAGDSDTEAQEFWSKCKKNAKKFGLWILLCMQLFFTLLVWISYSTMDPGTSGDVFHSLNIFILPIFGSSFFVIICLPLIIFCLCCTRNTTRRDNGSPNDRNLPSSVTKPFLDTIENHEL